MLAVPGLLRGARRSGCVPPAGAGTSGVRPRTGAQRSFGQGSVAMTSLQDQGIAELGGRLSVLVRQKQDHVRLSELMRTLRATPPEQQTPVLRSLCRLVFPHAFAEEGVLWPVIRRVVPDGEALTLQVEREHQEVNELVTRLETMSSDDPARPGVLERLLLVLDEDVRDEEDDLLSMLQERVGVVGLRALGLAWEVLRRTAPTRAHPVVARRPPGNVLAALPLSVLDRLRDRSETLQERGVAPDAAAAAGTWLRRTAHRAEHLRLFTAGEDESTSRTTR